MDSPTHDDESAAVSDDAKPSFGIMTRLGVAFLSGGTTALVALLFVPVVTVTTSVTVSLTQLTAVALVAGVVITVDSARQQSPRVVIVRTAYFISTFMILGGVALGIYVWTQLTPAQTQEGQLIRYAPLVPVVLGLVVGGLIGGFGTLYRRRTTPRAYE